MADKIVNFTPIDHFALGGDFRVIKSSDSQPRDQEETHSSDGKTIVGVAQWNTILKKSASYQYGGADLAGDLETAIKLGAVVNSILVEKVTVSLANKKAAEITIDGHNHGTNAHASGLNEYALGLTAIIGAAQGEFGLAAVGPWANSETNADQISLELTFSLKHVDTEGRAGAHFVGENFAAKVEAKAEYIGTPTLTTTGWYLTDTEGGENQETAETVSVPGWKPLAIAV